MERWHRPGALKKWRDRARQCACSGSRNQRGMIEAPITKACRVSRDRHQRSIAAELVLHRTNGRAQPDPKWFSQRWHTVELQRAHHLAESAFVRTNPCTSNAARWCGALFNAASTSETKLAATLEAEERPLHTTGAATLRGKER